MNKSIIVAGFAVIVIGFLFSAVLSTYEETYRYSTAEDVLLFYNAQGEWISSGNIGEIARFTCSSGDVIHIRLNGYVGFRTDATASGLFQILKSTQSQPVYTKGLVEWFEESRSWRWTAPESGTYCFLVANSGSDTCYFGFQGTGDYAGMSVYANREEWRTGTRYPYRDLGVLLALLAILAGSAIMLLGVMKKETVPTIKGQNRFCERCGQEVSPTASFCPSCGRSLGKVS